MVTARTLAALSVLAASLMLAAAIPSQAASTVRPGATEPVPVRTALPPRPKIAPPPDRGRTPESPPDSGSPRVSWGYAGPRGPAHWGSLSTAYRTCGTGTRQSPINIVDAGPARLAPLHFHYKLSLVHLSTDGKSLKAAYERGSYLTIGATRYALTGFEFHVPSEHTIAGRRFPIEIQFDHRDASGHRVIVSVLGTVGGNNLAVSEISDHLPKARGDAIVYPRVLMNARDLLPDTRRYFRYKGSLTVPPCTEGVDWIVLAAPIRLSEKQIARFQRVIGVNARPVQKRDERYLVQSVASG